VVPAAFLASGLLPHALCLLIAGKGVQQGVIDQMERVRPAVRSDLKAGRLMLAEYRGSAVAQLDFWRARIRSALQEGGRRSMSPGTYRPASWGGCRLTRSWNTKPSMADPSRARVSGDHVVPVRRAGRISGLDGRRGCSNATTVHSIESYRSQR